MQEYSGGSFAAAVHLVSLNFQHKAMKKMGHSVICERREETHVVSIATLVCFPGGEGGERNKLFLGKRALNTTSGLNELMRHS